MSITSIRWVCCLACIGLLISPAYGLAQDNPTGTAPGAIAVIVHPSNPETDISSEDLRRIFLGSTTSFSGGERVELVGLAGTRAPFYRSALGMSEARLKRHWIGRVFAGQPGTPPQEFRDSGGVLDYVLTHPGAIAFMPADSVSGNVKTLLIDGRAPADSGYAIR